MARHSKRSGETDRASRSASEEAETPANQLSSRSVALWALFVLALVVYAALFLGADAIRQQCWMLIVLPDALVSSWFGDGWSQAGFLDRGVVLLAAGLILAVAFFAGRAVMQLFGADRGLTRLERFVFAEGVGLNLLSLWTLLAGLAGWLHRPLLVGLPLPVLAGWSAWRWLAAKRRLAATRSGALDRPPQAIANPSEAPTRASRLLERLALALCVPFAAIIVLGGMLPPFEFDVLEYHLQVPKEWFQQGYVGFLPHNVYGNMPLGAEMHALLAMVFMPQERPWWWGALAGKTVMACYPLLTALALIAAGRRFFSPQAGAVAAFVYLSIPWTAYVAGIGFNEGALAFYLLLSVYAVMLWRRGQCESADVASNDRKAATGRVLLCGFLAGSAIACKYPSLLLVAFPLGVWVLLVDVWQRSAGDKAPSIRLNRINWVAAALFILAMALACGPWFAKNWALTGNPTYPLLYGVFDGASRTPALNAQWSHAHAVPPYSLSDLTARLKDIAWQSRWLSPLVWPFAVLAFVGSAGRRQAIAIALMIGWVLATWWLATHRIERFWVPMLPLASLLAGVGAAIIVAKGRDALWPWTVAVVLVCGAITSFLVAASPAIGDNRYFVSLEALRTDLPHKSDIPGRPDKPGRLNPVIDYINRNTPPGMAVLMVGEARAFDLEVPMLYNTCFDPNVFERLMEPDPTREGRLAKFRQHKVAYVYVNWSEIERYRRPGNYGYTDYVTPELIDEELASRQGLLQRVETGWDPAYGELFEVVGTIPR